MTTSIQNRRKIYDEFIDFLAAGVTPETLVNFQYSESTQEELEDLIYRAKMKKLTPEEQKELDKVLVLEHIVTLAKAKAHIIMQIQSKPSH
jgi:predicted nucleic acid-binding protein